MELLFVRMSCLVGYSRRSNVHFEMKNDSPGFKFILVCRRRDSEEEGVH